MTKERCNVWFSNIHFCFEITHYIEAKHGVTISPQILAGSSVLVPNLSLDNFIRLLLFQIYALCICFGYVEHLRPFSLVIIPFILITNIFD